ncbi:phasin family protein [Caballeronia sp. LZ019]|uniref:phasin family protein n=1 Tax=Caballeronia sp. LZ019 TaxID=3038555 RepID=UPI00285FBFBF|nr:phasin family protein [Caballeronia sp. LZ019]MDR5807313.1 phasin family protein [Caballeronia sp. LZ019]
MFQYPGNIAYQIPSIARANLQAFLNASGRFASGLQELTELNVQTVRTVIEESNNLLKPGEDAGSSVLGWQSALFAQIPLKAASYGQNVWSIITLTEADILGEVRNQYERNGITLKGLFDTATNEAQETAQSAAQETGVVITNLAETASEATQAAQETSGVILDASGDIASEIANAPQQLGETVETPIAKASRASSRRQS